MDKTRKIARSLRHSQTTAEQRLWGHLRKRSLGGFRFNRQVPIGPFVVDFLCRERRLIIEVDGATHGTPEEMRRDLNCARYLRTCGYAVHRAENFDVFTNIEGVMDSILWALQERPASFAKNPLSPPDSSPYK